MWSRASDRQRTRVCRPRRQVLTAAGLRFSSLPPSATSFCSRTPFHPPLNLAATFSPYPLSSRHRQYQQQQQQQQPPPHHKVRRMTSPSDDAASPSATSTPDPPTPSLADGPAQDRSQLLAQAIRFLTSARVSGDATDETKREFLRSKGLTEAEIQTVFEDATKPAYASVGAEGASTSDPSSSSSSSSSSTAETDENAFQRAARQFDDPINAESLAPPPKTYPKSPLALYYEAPDQGQPRTASTASGSAVAEPQSPLTRYQVLLQFFKTLSYLMMLGGGATALAVALWRSYVLPRMTATLEARSIALKHHIVLFDKLRSSVLGMATYLPASASEAAAQHQQQQRRGVLKKVHFGDEVDGGKLDDGTAADATTALEKTSKETQKVVLPGTDVVVDAVVSEKTDGLDGEKAGLEATASEEAAEPAQPKLEPIDLTEPLRQSISRLASVLRADMSSSALGKPIDPTLAADVGAASAPTSMRGPRSATVADAASDSGSEWSDSDADTVSDDGLEFDPYGSYNKKKHTQASPSSSFGGSGASTSSRAGSLRTSLASLSAEINSRQFLATTQSFPASSTGGGLRFGALPASSTMTTTTTMAGSGANETRSGEIGQVKAEIRSLKGLLLSRRNFPSYRLAAAPATAERAGGTVV
ncbi:hypothetical protein ACQY0O_007663 [Thecaphora frezii]